MKQIFKNFLKIVIVLATIASNIQYIPVHPVPALLVHSAALNLSNASGAQSPAATSHAQQQSAIPVLQVLPLVLPTAIQPQSIQFAVLPAALNITALQPTADIQALAISKTSNANQQGSVALSVHPFISIFALNIASTPQVMEHPEFAENIPVREEALPIPMNYSFAFNTQNGYYPKQKESTLAAIVESKGFVIPDMTVVLRC